LGSAHTLQALCIYTGEACRPSKTDVHTTPATFDAACKYGSYIVKAEKKKL